MRLWFVCDTRTIYMCFDWLIDWFIYLLEILCLCEVRVRVKWLKCTQGLELVGKLRLSLQVADQLWNTFSVTDMLIKLTFTDILLHCHVAYLFSTATSYLALPVWLNGLVVSALGMRTRRPGFESRVTPLFHWVATLGKLFTHIASPVSQLQETGVQKGVFGA